MTKVHIKISGIDRRSEGQTEYEHNNQTLCGYACALTTVDENKVTCLICKRHLNKYKEYISD